MTACGGELLAVGGRDALPSSASPHHPSRAPGDRPLERAHRRAGPALGSVTVPIRGNFQASNGDALVAAALAGQGLVYEPTFLLGDDIRAGRLVALTLDQPPMELPGVFAVYASNRRPPAKVRAFIDFPGATAWSRPSMVSRSRPIGLNPPSKGRAWHRLRAWESTDFRRHLRRKPKSNQASSSAEPALLIS
ncbi:LysR substrate-binding domain-containing protein [Microvirga arabica]|uniref:LysR substrate-binding domain-containing protein n=1 Tax=Microvirga arabica TaxID=1128671 RepID=UPI00362002CE